MSENDEKQLFLLSYTFCMRPETTQLKKIMIISLFIIRIERKKGQ